MIIRGENSGLEPDTDQRMFRVMITGLETPEELECYCRPEDRAPRNRVPILMRARGRGSCGVLRQLHQNVQIWHWTHRKNKL